ncbi:hypothetical protein [Gordonia liuliyuniae]|uniref:Uncharacterized protein n=1 Tax=Gordonia liuliyuniae TaxID=2911517 RepID=A0ABS9IXV8_9ACTN|nr:hypothetical protein [Gordonia liuliyuniae]MCF8590391.1 hypothetical protein [Gordonia liuliyuniae]
MEPVVTMWIVVAVAALVAAWTWSRGVPLSLVRTFSPVRAAQQESAARHRRRTAECERFEASARASGHAVEQGHFSGFETLAVDVWMRRDFTLRHRAVGLGWIPFVPKPEHHETREVTRGRLERAYRLNDEERTVVQVLHADDGGRIAIAAAVVAARIYRYPVWHSGLFEDVYARVDLADEVTYLTRAATEIRDQFGRAEAPTGPMASDEDVVALYIQKSNLLQSRLDALLERLRALDELRTVVARLQTRSDKNDWLDSAGSLDDVDVGADAVADSLYAVDIRDRAKSAEAAAAIHFESARLPKLLPEAE